MASKNLPVYLGFLDEQVNTKNQHHLSFAASKVGGVPKIVTIIEHCMCLLVLILHVGIDLKVLDGKQLSSPQLSEVSSAETWMEGEDDWGSSDVDDGNGNVCPSSQLVLEYMSRKAKVLADVENNCNFAENLNVKNINTSCHALSEVSKCMENKLNLNEGIGGDGMEATAVIEGSEGDMIAVETPEQSVTDIPALFKEVPLFDFHLETAFISYFVSTGVEPPEDINFSDHERELFLQYTNSTGHDIKEEDCFGNLETQGGDSVYEKNSAHHGDNLLHKFKKRISRSPQQIIRYCREESATPLWIKAPSSPLASKLCDYCGGRLIFEAQIMPQLVSCLRVKEFNGIVLEFGTVVIFTCMSSCWAEGDIVRQEVCFVQSEEV
ncbi:Programmed cell death protein 2-like [Armadillidium nasatum]|uniref:Programmed cell death protein 2-like n=1 Tax=Armadillidium nasatum TaxID=96803 RepID=A0A5N5SNH5_9CRUS|nr:Programmed cell death protein 2-like [Armadillidium nasatum]